MKSVITIGIEYDQVLEDVRAIIRHALQNHTPRESSEKTEVLGDALLTVREAAELLDVTVQTVHEWKRRGLLKYHKLGSRSYLKRADVLSALTGQQRTIKPGKGTSRG